ncbi:MAG: aspartate aminotransferase family protein [Candidatus Hodarchaeales archaeon]
MVDAKEVTEKDDQYFVQGYKRIPVVITEGKGATLKDIEGNEYIDCIAGIGVNNIGHAPERLAKVAFNQMSKLIHCSGLYYSIPQTLLVEKLAKITPGDLKKTFLCNSGVEAVDNAVKIAKKYAITQGKTGAGFISLELSFHGRLGFALSLTGQSKYKKGFDTYAYSSGIVHAPAPYSYRSPLSEEECGIQAAIAVEELIDRRTTGDIAGMIFEPIIGEGGIIVPPDSYFETIQKILKEKNIPLIIDEVQTGFGRTGKMFASEHWNLQPELMTMAKGLGGGVPIGAVIAIDPVANAIKSGDMFSTFGGNPVCSAVALENIKMIEEEGLVDHSEKMGKFFMEGLEELKEKRSIIGDVRGKGLMIGIELVNEKKSKEPAKQETAKIASSLRTEGIIIGSGGFYSNVLRLQPPLVITEEQGSIVLEKLDAQFKKYH